MLLRNGGTDIVLTGPVCPVRVRNPAYGRRDYRWDAPKVSVYRRKELAMRCVIDSGHNRSKCVLGEVLKNPHFPWGARGLTIRARALNAGRETSHGCLRTATFE
ncbi:hypothetical protein DSC45_16455 [Streptomyces sp. YIM 130001]|nr:hypothetical protein DSC45_16455 [Streptomyces sp. YIM 130001]